RQKHKNAPCLTVNDEPGNRWWHCNHPTCGWSGNLDLHDKFVRVQENSKMPKQIPSIYSQEVMEYWKKRGIDYRIAIKERVFEYMLGRKPIIGFPTYINNTLVNVMYLNIRWQPGDDGPKFWQLSKEHGTKIIPWGMQSLEFNDDELKQIIWTEGHVDRLTWMTAGYKNVISEPQGAPSVSAKDFRDKFAYTEDVYFKSVIADVELIIFSTDGDDPGRALRNNLSVIFGKERCKYINYPVGYKDINEVWKGDTKKNLPALGQEGVDECYQNLSSFPLKGIVRPQDVRDELEILANDGFTPGYGVGIPDIDERFTVKRKLVMGVTGIPSMGKSTWVRWLTTEITRTVKTEQIKWAFFSPENRPPSREQAKMAELLTHQSFKRGYKNSMTEDLRASTMRYIQEHFFFISPNKLNFETWSGKVNADRVNTIESLLQYLIYLKKTENIFGFVIDAWNKIDHEQPKHLTETAFISKQLDYIINFCDVYDLFCIIIAHPTKIEKIGINFRIPSLYDIKGSSAWFEKLDIGIAIHRYIYVKVPSNQLTDDSTEDDKVEIDNSAPTVVRVEKIKFEEIGSPGKFKMRMDISKGRSFQLISNDKKTPTPQPIKGALNPPKNKNNDDEVFGNNKDDSDGLPF
ncbi:MAG: hypothetical protein LLG05_05185, partial [Porphyromonadaceae bacterium]|nr:hypothetical protein [Porphyromonadaceae bacterium]